MFKVVAVRVTKLVIFSLQMIKAFSVKPRALEYKECLEEEMKG